MLLTYLSLANLAQSELKLYEFMLDLGEATAATIAHKIGMKRPTVYKLLEDLEGKGLVVSRDIGKIRHFKPEPPARLLERAKETREAHVQATLELEALIPHLTSAYMLSVERPIVTTFDGVEGLKAIYNDQVETGQEIYALVNTAEVHPELFEWLTTVHVKDRVKKNVHATVIVSTGKWSDQYMKRDEKELRTTRVVPRFRFPFEHEVDIYGDKVAFVNYKKGEALIGVVITHPLIAKTMRAFFDLAWLGSFNTSFATQAT